MQLVSTSPVLPATSLRLRLTLRALLAGLLSIVIVGVVSNGNAYAFTSPASTGNSTFTSVAVYAPHNTALPVISGTAQQGELLSTTNGVWSYSPVSYAYQWRDCDGGGANCTDIPGATASTYVPVSADTGLTLRVKVTATNSGGSTVATSAQTSVVTVSAPVNSVLPAVTGTTQQGQALTATTGTWSLSPTGYTYQWQDCDSAGATCASVAAGGTASTYVLTAGDVGRTMRVVVTATNASGSHAAASLATGLVVGTITNFVTGLNAGTNPSATIAGPDGNLWFTDLGTTKAIGKITVTGGITNYSAGLLAGSSPSGITLGPDGNLWFADRGTTKAFGTITANGAITMDGAGLLAGNSPMAVTSGPLSDGKLWFTQQGTTPAIGKKTIPTGTLSFYPTGLNAGSSPSSIALGPDDNLWFTDAGTTSAIGKITPSGTITEFSTGLNAGSVPRAITRGADGNLWFTDQGTTPAIGKITPAGVITMYGSGAGLNAGSSPFEIGTGADGNVWFTDRGTTKAIGRITPAGTITEYTTGLAAGNNLYGITRGADGNLWFTDQGTTKAVGRVNIGGPITATLPTITGSAVQDSTLTIATTPTWTGNPAPTVVNRWQRCDTSGVNCTTISGATGTTYVLAGSDVGATVRGAATASNTLGSATVASLASATVQGPGVNTVLPVITGTTQQTQTLTTTSGSWSSVPAPSFAYQWQRCNATGKNCANIVNANAATYVPVVTDVGQTLQVVVTASSAGGGANATSAVTGLIVGMMSGFTIGLSVGASPYWMTDGPDGNVWFTDQGSSKAIGKITPSGTITMYSVGLNAGASPRVITRGPDGNLWFADQGTTSAIGRITPNGDITMYSFGLNVGSRLFGITAGPDGNLWFTDQGTTKAIGKITPQGVISEYSTGLNAGSSPQLLSPGSEADGNVWFTDSGTTSAIGKITLAGTITEYSAGLNSSSIPRDITLGSDGRLWFTVGGTTPAIGMITPLGVITETTTGLTTGSVPFNITTGADGNVWFTDRGTTHAIGRITPGGAVSEYIVGLSAGNNPYAITAGPDGNIWFDDQGPTKPITRLNLGGPINTTLPAITGTMHQGSTLTTTNGAWSGTPAPAAFAYQWQRCDASGLACAAISLATNNTYVLTAGDIGSTIRAAVSATNTFGTANAASAQTGVIAA